LPCYQRCGLTSVSNLVDGNGEEGTSEEDETPKKRKSSKRKESEKIMVDGIVLEGWRLETRTRQRGGTKGRVDNYWWSPTGKQFRSRVEILRYLKEEQKTTLTLDSKKRKRTSSSRQSAKRSRTTKKTNDDSVSKSEAWAKYVNEEDNVIDINLKVPYVSKEGLLEAVCNT